MRRAAKGFHHEDEDHELTDLLARVKRAAKESIAMIDDALSFVTASNKRVAKLEQRRN